VRCAVRCVWVREAGERGRIRGRKHWARCAGRCGPSRLSSGLPPSLLSPDFPKPSRDGPSDIRCLVPEDRGGVGATSVASRREKRLLEGHLAPKPLGQPDCNPMWPRLPQGFCRVRSISTPPHGDGRFEGGDRVRVRRRGADFHEGGHRGGGQQEQRRGAPARQGRRTEFSGGTRRPEPAHLSLPEAAGPIFGFLSLVCLPVHLPVHLGPPGSTCRSAAQFTYRRPVAPLARRRCAWTVRYGRSTARETRKPRTRVALRNRFRSKDPS